MTKKLFYLLATFIMSWLLVVGAVACGSRSSTDPNGGGDPVTNNPGGASDIDITDLGQSKIFGQRFIQNANSANNYRFPVVVAYSNSTVNDKVRDNVIIFYEERYGNNGTAQDVGIAGTNAVDVKYIVNMGQNGMNGFNGPFRVGDSNGQENPKDNARGAPYVFVVTNSSGNGHKIVVFATAGDGLYGDSKVMYIVGTPTESGGLSGEWKDATSQIKGNGSSGNNNKNIPSDYPRFGTWAGSGKSVGDKYYLPIVYTKDPSPSSGQSEWGVTVFSFKYPNNGDITLTLVTNSGTSFNSTYGESKILASTTGNGNGPTLGVRNKAAGQKPGTANVPTDGNGISAPNGNINILDGGSGSIFESAVSNTAIYFINAREHNTQMTLSKFEGNLQATPVSVTLNKHGKAGSVAVLSDGTIFVASEDGKRSGADRNFDVAWRRITPGFITSHNGQTFSAFSE